MLSSMKAENVRRNIQRAVKALDKENPDWRQKINLETFTISDSIHCVLGQVYGSCPKAPAHLQRYKAFWWADRHWDIGTVDQSTSLFAKYNKAWRKILSA